MRRKEEGLYRPGRAGTVQRAVVGAFAVGSVLADGVAPLVFGEWTVRRLAIWCDGDAVAVPAVGGGYAWECVSILDDDPVKAFLDLQNRMRKEEGRLAEALAGAGRTVIVDGPLSHIQNRDLPVIGYIKVQHRRHLAEEQHGRLIELAGGERTSIFRLGEKRLSCYLRLEERRPMTGPWHAIVRLEFPAPGGLPAAVAAADLACGLLPRYASLPWRDPRAPQNLCPVGGLEERLRHLLGDQTLAARAVRDAVVALSAAAPAATEA